MDSFWILLLLHSMSDTKLKILRNKYQLLQLSVHDSVCEEYLSEMTPLTLDAMP